MTRLGSVGAEPRVGQAGDTGCVVVRLPGPLRELAGGRAEVEVRVGGAGTAETGTEAEATGAGKGSGSRTGREPGSGTGREPGAASVAAVLESLVRAYPGLGRHLREETGALRNHVNVFVGDQDIRHLDGMATGVRAPDTVTIVPSIAGG